MAVRVAGVGVVVDEIPARDHLPAGAKTGRADGRVSVIDAAVEDGDGLAGAVVLSEGGDGDVLVDQRGERTPGLAGEKTAGLERLDPVGSQAVRGAWLMHRWDGTRCEVENRPGPLFHVNVNYTRGISRDKRIKEHESFPGMFRSIPGRTDNFVHVGRDLIYLVGRRPGRGGLRPAPGSPFTTGKGTWRLAIADFNQDGKPDVAATCLEAGHVAVLLGR